MKRSFTLPCVSAVHRFSDFYASTVEDEKGISALGDGWDETEEDEDEDLDDDEDDDWDDDDEDLDDEDLDDEDLDDEDDWEQEDEDD